MKKIKEINQNIEAVLQFNSSYEEKKEQIKLKPVKIGYVYLFGTLGSILAICSIEAKSLSELELASLGGYAIGCTIPYIIKKIRIADLDYQIYMNVKIINDLKNEKAKIIRR